MHVSRESASGQPFFTAVTASAEAIWDHGHTRSSWCQQTTPRRQVSVVLITVAKADAARLLLQIAVIGHTRWLPHLCDVTLMCFAALLAMTQKQHPRVHVQVLSAEAYSHVVFSRQNAKLAIEAYLMFFN